MICGPEKMAEDLKLLGLQPELVKGPDGNTYAVMKDFKIELGKFAGRVIDLSILALPDYPRMVHSSIHIKADPQLYEKTDSVQGVRNIVDSGLGPEWRYWSFAFKATPEDTAANLMMQINGVFKRI